MSAAVLPITVVLSLSVVNHLSYAMLKVVYELTFILVTIGKQVFSATLTDSLGEISLINIIVRIESTCYARIVS